MINTVDTVAVEWSEATVLTFWMALSGVNRAVLIAPVGVTFTGTVVIAMGIAYACVTVNCSWAITANALSVTVSNILGTAVPGPVVVTDTESVGVEVRVLHTVNAVALFWATTAVATDVTVPNPDGTV